MKGIKKILFWFFIAASAITLTSLGIDAADHINNFSESIIGSAFSGDKGACPDGMVHILDSKDGFCIDKFENAPGADCSILNPANQSDTVTDLDELKCRPVSAQGSVPWTNISQDQAKKACAKAGKRLPTSEEWSLAALGTPDKNSGWTEDDCQVSSNWTDQPGKAGSAKNCASAAGAYDMIGNVWEWVSGTSDNGMYEDLELPDEGFVISTDGKGMPAKTDPSSPDPNYNNDYFWVKKQGIRGLAKGGYWNNDSKAGEYSTYLVSLPSFAGIGVGFRCAK